MFFGLGRRVAHVSAEARHVCLGAEVEALVGSLVPYRRQCYRKYEVLFPCGPEQVKVCCEMAFRDLRLRASRGQWSPQELFAGLFSSLSRPPGPLTQHSPELQKHMTDIVQVHSLIEDTTDAEVCTRATATSHIAGQVGRSTLAKLVGPRICTISSTQVKCATALFWVSLASSRGTFLQQAVARRRRVGRRVSSQTVFEHSEVCLVGRIGEVEFPCPHTFGWKPFRPRSALHCPDHERVPRRNPWSHYVLFTQLVTLLGGDLCVLKFRGHHGHLCDRRQRPPHGGPVSGA